MATSTLDMAGLSAGQNNAMPTGYDPTAAMMGELNEFAANMPLNQIVAQDINLGIIRDLVPPQDHIGLSIAPWQNVAGDEVIWNYVKDFGAGMAPARAEDSEARLTSTQEFWGDQGRASIIDWSHKSHYTASQVSRYREAMAVIEAMNKTGKFPLTVQSIATEFDARVTRDTIRRRTMLDNRINWLITQALDLGYIAYNDGKIIFNVNFQRPAAYQDQAPASGTYLSNTHDPINDLLKVKEKMHTEKGVTLTDAWCDQYYLNSLYKSKKFGILTGFAPGTLDDEDMPYALKGWGPKAAIETVEAETGIRFHQTDSVMRSFAKGSNVASNVPYIRRGSVILLPDMELINQLDDTGLGFARTLSSPHPMGNWAPGFYSWEAQTNDPWGRDVGSGVKAFPIFPHLDKSYVMKTDA